MKSSFSLILVCLLSMSFITDLTCDAKYCKPPGKRMYEKGKCKRCQKCEDGTRTNHDEALLHDDRFGYLDCYTCTPCPEGMYSNSDTRIGRKLQCQQWINCTELNMVYDIWPTSTYIGKCGRCLPGYYPQKPFNNCVKCTLESDTELECKNFTAISPSLEEGTGQNKTENKSTPSHKIGKRDHTRTEKKTESTSSSGSHLVKILMSSVVGTLVLLFAPCIIVYFCWRKRQSSEDTPLSSVGHSADSVNNKPTDPLLSNPEVRIVKPLQDMCVDQGDMVKLECEISQKDIPATWFMGDSILSSDRRISISASNYLHSLLMRFIKTSDSGTYKVKFPDGTSGEAKISVQDKHKLSDEERSRSENLKLCQNKLPELNSLISTRIPPEYHDWLYTVLCKDHEHIIHNYEIGTREPQYVCCSILDRLVQVKGPEATLYYMYSKLYELYLNYIDDMNEDAVKKYSVLLQKIKKDYISISEESNTQTGVFSQADNDNNKH